MLAFASRSPVGCGVTDTVTRRIGLVQALAHTGVTDEARAETVALLKAYAEGDEPVLAYEAARALRLLGPR